MIQFCFQSASTFYGLLLIYRYIGFVKRYFGALTRIQSALLKSVLMFRKEGLSRHYIVVWFDVLTFGSSETNMRVIIVVIF